MLSTQRYSPWSDLAGQILEAVGTSNAKFGHLTGWSSCLTLSTLQGRWADPPSWAVTFVTRLLSNIGPSSFVTGADGRKSWLQGSGMKDILVKIWHSNSGIDSANFHHFGNFATVYLFLAKYWIYFCVYLGNFSFCKWTIFERIM